MSDMLRNWSETLPGGMLISGTEFCGLLAEDIEIAAAGGDVGAGIMSGFGLVAGKRYKLVIDTSTFEPGRLWLNEDGSGYSYGPGTFTFNLYEESLLIGAPLADRVVTITVGDDAGPISYVRMREVALFMSELHLIHGLLAGSPLTVTQSSRDAGSISQTLTGTSSVVVERA